MCSRGNILAELATAPHVHLENDHAKEVAVLAGFTLARHRRYLRVERMVLIAIFGCNDVEVAAPVAAAARTAIGLHLDRDSTGTVHLGLVMRVIMVDAHLGWRDRGRVQVTSQSRRWWFLHRGWTTVIGHFGGDCEQ